MARRAKSANVVLERALVLEIRATKAEPTLATVLLVGAPVTLDGKGLATLAASEGLESVLALVVCLEGPKVLQWLSLWVVYVVLASFLAAVAWHAQYCPWLRPFQRVWSFAVLRSMPPHVHLKIIIAIKGFVAEMTREMSEAH